MAGDHLRDLADLGADDVPQLQDRAGPAGDGADRAVDVARAQAEHFQGVPGVQPLGGGQPRLAPPRVRHRVAGAARDRDAGEGLADRVRDGGRQQREGFGRRLVPRAIADFRRAHPDVTFRLDVVPRQEATRRVVEGNADVAVTYAMGPQHDVRVECAVVVPVSAVVPLGHELAGRDRIGLAELCAHPLALGSPGTSQRELFDIAVRLEGLTVRPALVCDSHAPQCQRRPRRVPAARGPGADGHGPTAAVVGRAVHGVAGDVAARGHPATVITTRCARRRTPAG
ncbi:MULTISPECIES: LysR substrate-binding domain-containing protein [unclassified Streptomyces]|uniref:LysR substrate-binding domain-containing protein n=1 Tax=unclassified Streptomyces TaxID=2593676 RepID=UPI002034C1B8|nr:MULTISPECIES: LysR substrate-binding domain-containing protein [unclassified Streptomyces]